MKNLIGLLQKKQKKINNTAIFTKKIILHTIILTETCRLFSLLNNYFLTFQIQKTPTFFDNFNTIRPSPEHFQLKIQHTPRSVLLS